MNYLLDDFFRWISNYSDNVIASYSALTGFVNFLKLALAVISVIGMWKMFAKAGENDWGAIIPFYNKYLLFKLADMKNWYWAYLAGYCIYSISLIVAFFALLIAAVSSISSRSDYNKYFIAAAIAGVLLAVSCIFTFVLRIIKNIKLAKNFNLSGWWAVGLILIPAIFYMIIGFSDKIRFKNRPVSGPLPGQLPNGQGADGYARNTYGQTYDPYGSQNSAYNSGYSSQGNTYAPNNPYGQNNPYAQSNPYGQGNPYGHGNPYAQGGASNSQNVYGQGNPYAQGGASNGQNVYGQVNPYGQNAGTGAQNNVQGAPGSSADGSLDRGRDEAVWKTIYDDNANNIK